MPGVVPWHLPDLVCYVPSSKPSPADGAQPPQPHRASQSDSFPFFFYSWARKCEIGSRHLPGFLKVEPRASFAHPLPSAPLSAANTERCSVSVFSKLLQNGCAAQSQLGGEDLKTWMEECHNNMGHFYHSIVTQRTVCSPFLSTDTRTFYLDTNMGFQGTAEPNAQKKWTTV